MHSLHKLLAGVTTCLARYVNENWEEEVAEGSAKKVAVSTQIAAGILRCKAASEVQHPLGNFLTAALQLNLLTKVGTYRQDRVTTALTCLG